MNNLKYAFFAVAVVVMIYGCNHRGANPYDVKPQNKQVYFDMPVNRNIYDDVTKIIDNDSNEQIEKIIGGNR